MRLLKLLLLPVLLLAAPAHAEERVALVVGNSGYTSISALDNPSNDARLIAQTLEDLGFNVTLLLDSSQSDMKTAIRQFGRALRSGGEDTTGLFYYAGHGVQSFGTNYLLPVDTSLSDAADLDLVAIEAQSVLRQMFSAKNRTNIVILDACRNNPFDNIPDFTDNGLAEMKAPTGTFLAYATAPGAVALDGEQNNSPFTQALVAQMATPGQPIEQVFKDVRISVLEATGGQQTPWDTSSLTTDFSFAQAAAPTPEEIAEEQLWSSVLVTRDPVQVMLFLRAYPDSRYGPQARALLQEVMRDELAGAADNTPTAPPAAAQGPSQAEQDLFEAAQAENSVSAYQAYLDAFPQGTFAEFAQGEIDALTEGQQHDPEGEGVSEPAQVAAAPATTLPPQQDITFTTPLTSGNEATIGKTLEQLIASEPMFPPIEGLPDSYWKGQTCKSCHDWNRQALCDQANVYLNIAAQRSLTKQHPFGGAMKQNLRIWAAGECR